MHRSDGYGVEALRELVQRYHSSFAKRALNMAFQKP